MANTLQTIRGKVPSKRVLLAVGGAAAIALGAVQTADTMAADTDAANAKATQVASQNYTPAPVPTSIACNDSGISGSKRANISWTNMGSGYKYRIEQWRDNSSFKWSEDLTNAYYNRYNTGSPNVADRVRIRTINIATNEISTGYISVSVHGYAVNTWCTGTFPQENVTSWQQSSSWNPGTPETITDASGPDTPTEFQRNAPKETEESKKPSETPTAEPSESAKPSESESESPETAETEPSTSETSAPSTSTPKPSSPETSETETPAKITVSVGAAGEASGFTIYKDGVESCFADKAPTDNVSVGNGEVVLTTADGAVKKVDPDTCKVS